MTREKMTIFGTPFFASCLLIFGSFYGTPLMGIETIDYAFVSLADENKVSVYELNKSTAKMKLVSEAAVEGDSGSQFFDTKRSVLYLGLRNAGKIVALKFDRGKKKLQQINVVKVDKDPAYLHVDKSGKWLLAAYYATGRVSCHPLKENGEIRNTPQWVTTAPNAHAIITDATNRYVFVPHTGPNSIFQFRFDSNDGSLKPNDPDKLKTKEKTGPRHIIAHPKHDTVFFAINEQGSSLSELRMEADTGLLRPIKTISTIDEGNLANNACSDLEISNNGKFIYGANRGDDTIALFLFSSTSGIDLVKTYKTEKTPRQFSLSPDNRFLVAAGQNSNKLALFRVNPNNGHLTRVGTQKTGKKPWWITIVD